MVSHYSAPFSIFDDLPASNVSSTVCLGEEWYRFPSHYFLPENYRVRWTKSSFDGALPQYFSPYPLGISQPPDERLGFNHLNKPPPDETFARLDQCDYLVANGNVEKDRLLQGHPSVSLIARKCAPLLDKSATTHPIARILGIPSHRRVWTDFCLYKVHDAGV